MGVRVRFKMSVGSQCSFGLREQQLLRSSAKRRAEVFGNLLFHPINLVTCLLLSLQFRNARSTLRAVVASSNQSISNVALGAFFGAGAALSAAALSAATLPAAALGSPAPASTSNAPVSTSNDG